MIDMRLRPWGLIHDDFKTIDESGTRLVMAYVEGVGTCLVPWIGPSEEGAR